jgi:hypothetical protein
MMRLAKAIGPASWRDCVLVQGVSSSIVSVERHDHPRGLAVAVLCSCLLLLLFQFLLHLAHFFSYAVTWTHSKAFPDQLDAEYQEQRGCSEVREALGKQGWHRVPENSGKHGHDDEGGECGGEDEQSWVSHGHQGSNEECLVADLREYDHGEGKNERMEGLYDAAVVCVW